MDVCARVPPRMDGDDGSEREPPRTDEGARSASDYRMERPAALTAGRALWICFVSSVSQWSVGFLLGLPLGVYAGIQTASGGPDLSHEIDAATALPSALLGSIVFGLVAF